jgi:hypothetical protein
MLYHKDFKINYWLPPRTASRMTKEMLMVVGFEGFTPNYHDLVIYDNSWDLIVNVRNPYSAYVSAYHTVTHSKTQTFKEYLDLGNQDHMQGKFMDHWDVGSALKRYNLIPNKIVRYENLQEDILSLDFIKCNLLNLESLIDKLKEGKKPWREHYSEIANQPYHTFYNQELADIVWERKKYSFELLGYDRDSWKTIID